MANKVKIAVDAMSGENSPHKIINGIEISLKSNKDNFFYLYGDENLLKKCEWILQNKFNCSIVSQWTFDVKKTNDWILNIKRKTKSISNNYFDIHIGIAGPTKIITLIKYAKICGVSATFIIAKNKNIELRNLIKHNPNEIINGLENYDNLHFFPFGGIKELVKWKNEK